MTNEEQRNRVRNILQDFYRRDEYELEQATDDVMRLIPGLPPAEGAEEIRREYSEESLDFFRSFIKARKELCAISPTETYSLEEAIRKAFDEFATLHAQKIADKMVSEWLREELIKYEMEGSAYNEAFVAAKIDRYLKSLKP